MVGRALTVLCALAAVVSFPSPASGASAPPSSQALSSGFVPVTTCGALGAVTTAWTSTEGVVTQVRLSGIPGACVGGSLTVTLAGSGGTALGAAGPEVISGTTMALAPSGSPSATSVLVSHLVVVGP